MMKQREFFKTTFYHVIKNIEQAKLKKQVVKIFLCSEIFERNAMVDEEENKFQQESTICFKKNHKNYQGMTNKFDLVFA